MAEPACPSPVGTVPLRARVAPTLLEALDALAARESRPGAPVCRSAALRMLVLEALAARGVQVPA